MSKKSEAEKAEAIERLREWLQPGDTVYTVLRHVSRSGMQRVIGLVIFRDGQPLHPNYLAGTALGMRVDSHKDGLVVGGCGMDMGFHVVYELSHTLFPDGFPCTGNDDCPAGYHYNHQTGKREYPERHRDGGYALRHKWL